MTESQLTQRLRERIKTFYNDKIQLFKVSDRFTVGVPDIAWVNRQNGITTWLELKRFPGDLNHPVVPQAAIKLGPQLVNMLKLGECNAGVYAIFIEAKRTHYLTLWKPAMVHRAISGKFTMTMGLTQATHDAAVARFEEHGILCCGQAGNLDPLFWVIEHLENLRCRTVVISTT